MCNHCKERDEKTEEIKFDWNKPFTTAMGHPAKLLSTNYRSCYGLSNLVLISFDKIDISYSYCPKTGRTMGNYAPYDLVNTKEKKSYWTNIYRDYNKRCGRYTGRLYETKEKAEYQGGSSPDYIVTIQIEWEE